MSFVFDNIKYGLSDPGSGNMNLRLPDLDPIALENRRAFFTRLGLDPSQVVTVNLIHDAQVAVVTPADGGKILPDTDGLITSCPNVFLALTVADCVPIYLFDPKKSVVGLVHSGWRGTVNNIAGVAVAKMVDEFGSAPDNIHAYIGPHLQACHFEVQTDVASQFDQKFVICRGESMFVDLHAVIESQLLTSGLSLENIESSAECTYCNPDKYFSYRRDNPDKVQSVVAYIGMVV